MSAIEHLRGIPSLRGRLYGRPRRDECPQPSIDMAPHTTHGRAPA